jgi:hypothetical protein
LNLRVCVGKISLTGRLETVLPEDAPCPSFKVWVAMPTVRSMTCIFY